MTYARSDGSAARNLEYASEQSLPIGAGNQDVDRPIGRKGDTGKRRFSLIPSQAFRDVVDVLGAGATEYGDWNWLHVKGGRQRYYDALCRHLDAWWTDGEWLDPTTKLPHLAHLCCNALFLLSIARPEKDGES